jgi:hypothetical protein
MANPRIANFFVAAAAAFSTMTSGGIAQGAQEFDVFGTAQSFTWREFDDNGSQLLRESGPLFGVGVIFTLREEGSRRRSTFKGDLFGGQIDYVGQVNISHVPVTSDTIYFGFQGQGDMGWGIRAGERAELIPFVGAGVRWWVRSIDDSTDAFGTPVSGTEEFWSSYYLRSGLRGEVKLQGKKEATKDTTREEKNRTTLFAEVAARLPVYNENNVPDAGVILNPRIAPSLCAEIGLRGERLRVRAFYEGLRFKKSGDEISGSFTVWQPESEADIYGLSVGAAF